MRIKVGTKTVQPSAKPLKNQGIALGYTLLFQDVAF